MQRVATRVRRRVVRFGTGGHASFTADADAGVVKQPDRRAGYGNRARLRVQAFGAHAHGHGRRNAGLGDVRDQFSPSDGHVQTSFLSVGLSIFLSLVALSFSA